MRKKTFYEFSVLFLDLLTSGIQICESLKIMSNAVKTPKYISLSAQYILQEMNKGETFSSSISNNPYFSMAPKYTALFYSEERSGSIIKSLNYVISNEKRKNDSSGIFLKAAVYPCLIVIICILSSILLYQFESSFMNVVSKKVVMKGIAYSAIFLIMSISIFVACSCILLRESKAFLFLLSFSFYLEAGFDTCSSLLCCSMQFEAGSRVRNKIYLCNELLQHGKKFNEAINVLNFLDESFIMRTEYVEETGKIGEAIEGEIHRVKKKSDRLREFYLCLCEPVMIIITGIYLLIIIQFSVLPILTSFGGLM